MLWGKTGTWTPHSTQYKQQKDDDDDDDNGDDKWPKDLNVTAAGPSHPHYAAPTRNTANKQQHEIK
jgi:hypothetical protein